MKGIALPINMIVILAIAILVLVALAAFFVSFWIRSAESIGTEQAFGEGCVELNSKNCAVDPADIRIKGYDPYGRAEPGNIYDTQGDTLMTACQIKFNNLEMPPTECKERCGCR